MKQKCWQLLQEEKYDLAFGECYSAAVSHLHNVFAHFKRSDMFLKFVQGKSKSYLQTIGKHKSELTKYSVSVEELERPFITDQDMFVVQEMLQDYDYWQFVFADTKQGSSLMYSNRSFQTVWIHGSIQNWLFVTCWLHHATIGTNCSNQ